MRKRIKIGFIDKWGGWKPTDNIFYRILSKHYDVTIAKDPDYLICGTHNHRHVYCDAPVMIFDGMENLVPDFNLYDYAIGFDNIVFDDRYLRVPYYAMINGYDRLKDRVCGLPPSDEELLSRKFCSFVVSNGTGADPIRTEFFRKLSRYKKIDSGGMFMNNIGGAVKDKMSFIKNYKFNIAFENSSYPGYTTEKVMEPLAAWCVPIYWGNCRVGEDFNIDAMVVVRNHDDVDRAIDEIVRLDKDDDAYLAKVRCQCMTREYNFFENRLEEFLVNIVEQPIEKARRIPQYGFSPIYRARMRHLYKVDDTIKKPFRFARLEMLKLKHRLKLFK